MAYAGNINVVAPKRLKKMRSQVGPEFKLEDSK